MDRVRSGDVPTIDATLVSHGAVGRPAIELPDSADEPAVEDVPTDEVVRLSTDGSTRHARFDEFAGSARATGAFDAPDLARSPGEGENRLREWVDEQGLATGRTVHLDVIESGFAYGLRAPGEALIYGAPSSPDGSLASIAEELEDDS